MKKKRRIFSKTLHTTQKIAFHTRARDKNLKKWTESTARRYSTLIYSYISCSRFSEICIFCSRFYSRIVLRGITNPPFQHILSPSADWGVSSSSTTGIPQFHCWNSRIPHVEVRSSTLGIFWNSWLKVYRWRLLQRRT